MMTRLFCFLIMMPAMVWAQDVPALFNITGVAADDTLNIRSEPTTQSDVVGSFRHDQTGLEIVETDPTGRWGRINHNEGTGWVSMRYMQEWDTGDYALTRRVECSGTEPFWGVTLLQGGLSKFDWAGQSTELYSTGLLFAASGFSDRYAILGQSDGTQTIHATIRRQSCSDGMSDRQYGLQIDAILTGTGEPAYVSGCCSLLGN